MNFEFQDVDMHIYNFCIYLRLPKNAIKILIFLYYDIGYTFFG
jgi:hypothetical protein